MIVVSETSPIINLARVAHLPLLQQLYGTIVIPRAVFQEIAIVRAGEAGATAVRTQEWIQTKEITDRPLVTLLQLELDTGEAEAIALALHLYPSEVRNHFFPTRSARPSRSSWSSAAVSSS